MLDFIDRMTRDAVQLGPEDIARLHAVGAGHSRNQAQRDALGEHAVGGELARHGAHAETRVHGEFIGNLRQARRRERVVGDPRDRRDRERGDGPQRSLQATRRSTSEPLVPPNPKELESATSIFIWRAVPGT